jgi:hypothetical protein
MKRQTKRRTIAMDFEVIMAVPERPDLNTLCILINETVEKWAKENDSELDVINPSLSS